jgi:hypothetical protein
MTTKTLNRSFAGGEITPELYGRFELNKFQTGLALALNFMVLPHGPAVRRPGTKYVLQAKDSSKPVRIIPFTYSADDAVVIEVGHLYMRFHTNGGTILEANDAVVDVTGNLVEVTAHGYVVGDWVFIAGRYFIVATTPTVDTFTVTGLRGEAASPNPAATTCARVYTLTTTYDGSDVFDIHYAQDNEVLTLVHPAYPAQELRRVAADNSSLGTISFSPSLAAPTGVGVAPTIAVSSNLSPQSYVVTAVADDGATESLASSVVSTNNNLTLAGNFNTVSWSAHATATRYNVYKRTGGIFGYIGQTTTLSVVDNNITPDTSQSPPEALYSLNTGAGDYPSAVTYHEQRRWFGGSNLRPQTIHATRNGTDANLTSSVPSREDDALEFRVRAKQQNRVRHLVPLSDLMALTSSAEWRIFADNEPSITPRALSTKPLGYSGANNVQPVETAGSILYVQSRGSRVRELAFEGQGYRSIDLSIMAPHLVNGKTVVDMAYATAPEQIVWAVRNDGRLLGLTYQPEQQVFGWHQHSTVGLFKSACSVPEGMEDATYAVVERTIDSATVKYIERLQSRLFGALENAYFVDAGLTYSGAPTSTVGGLWHLEGETVQVLADGAVEPEQEVTGGEVQLQANASVVHVGKKYVSDLATLPLTFDQAAAAGQGMLKNVLAAYLRVTDTSLFLAGPNFIDMSPNRSREVSDPYDSPPSLKTREERVQIGGDWTPDGQACVRQDQPLPCTVIGMTLEVETGD